MSAIVIPDDSRCRSADRKTFEFSPGDDSVDYALLTSFEPRVKTAGYNAPLFKPLYS